MGADQPAAELQWPDGSGRTLLLSLRQQRQQDSMGPATGPGDRGRPAECRRHSLAAADGTTIASHTHASESQVSAAAEQHSGLEREHSGFSSCQEAPQQQQQLPEQQLWSPAVLHDAATRDPTLAPSAVTSAHAATFSPGQQCPELLRIGNIGAAPGTEARSPAAAESEKAHWMPIVWKPRLHAAASLQAEARPQLPEKLPAYPQQCTPAASPHRQGLTSPAQQDRDASSAQQQVLPPLQRDVSLPQRVQLPTEVLGCITQFPTSQSQQQLPAEQAKTAAALEPLIPGHTRPATGKAPHTRSASSPSAPEKQQQQQQQKQKQGIQVQWGCDELQSAPISPRAKAILQLMQQQRMRPTTEQPLAPAAPATTPPKTQHGGPSCTLLQQNERSLQQRQQSLPRIAVSTQRQSRQDQTHVATSSPRQAQWSHRGGCPPSPRNGRPQSPTSSHWKKQQGSPQSASSSPQKRQQVQQHRTVPQGVPPAHHSGTLDSPRSEPTSPTGVHDDSWKQRWAIGAGANEPQPLGHGRPGRRVAGGGKSRQKSNGRAALNVWTPELLEMMTDATHQALEKLAGSRPDASPWEQAREVWLLMGSPAAVEVTQVLLKLKEQGLQSHNEPNSAKLGTSGALPEGAPDKPLAPAAQTVASGPGSFAAEAQRAARTAATRISCKRSRSRRKASSQSPWTSARARPWLTPTQQLQPAAEETPRTRSCSRPQASPQTRKGRTLGTPAVVPGSAPDVPLAHVAQAVATGPGRFAAEAQAAGLRAAEAVSRMKPASHRQPTSQKPHLKPQPSSQMPWTSARAPSWPAQSQLPVKVEADNGSDNDRGSAGEVSMNSSQCHGSAAGPVHHSNGRRVVSDISDDDLPLSRRPAALHSPEPHTPRGNTAPCIDTDSDGEPLSKRSARKARAASAAGNFAGGCRTAPAQLTSVVEHIRRRLSFANSAPPKAAASNVVLASPSKFLSPSQGVWRPKGDAALPCGELKRKAATVATMQQPRLAKQPRSPLSVFRQPDFMLATAAPVQETTMSEQQTASSPAGQALVSAHSLSRVPSVASAAATATDTEVSTSESTPLPAAHVPQAGKESARKIDAMQSAAGGASVSKGASAEGVVVEDAVLEGVKPVEDAVLEDETEGVVVGGAEQEAVEAPPPLSLQLGPAHVVDPVEAADLEQRMHAYHGFVDCLTRQGQRKPDMVACGKSGLCKPQHGGWSMERYHGHVPGARVGQRFDGKGALCFARLHCNINAGIDCLQGKAAFAVVITGGYEDNDDTGQRFTYSGMGGRGKDGHQVKDQTWTAGNEALRLAMRQGIPVRVCRRVSQGNSAPVFSYDGLYRIIKAERKPGAAGFLICKFRMVGIPGHSQVSASVKFRHSGPRRVAPRQVLASPVKGPRPKPISKRDAAVTAKALIRADARRSSQSRRSGTQLVSKDISGGLEQIPIPVYNEIDNEQSPTETGKLLYRPDSYAALESIGALKILSDGTAAMEQAFLNAGRPRCGLRINRGKTFYNGGRLKETHPGAAVFECPPDCDGKHPSKCAGNRVVSEGIRAPLQVFKTRDYGWGVRCARGVEVGEYLCSYSAPIFTEQEANQLQDDTYLFEMNDFARTLDEGESRETWSSIKHLLPPMPPKTLERELSDDEHPRLLVMDAAKAGGVARFLNHSCDPNVLSQAVMCPGDSGVCYHIALFAAQDIPAFTELRYDYQWTACKVKQNKMCCCGTANCKGNLYADQ
mmetsp:Transcript_8053/g.23879  ORF Transcript_8053/g.23879 Transcript_8053/m.23879 type:complete len:1721 (-) Transcript_8053:2384-7546(-)